MRNTFLLLIPFFFAVLADATTTYDGPGTKSDSADVCEVEAKFLGERFTAKEIVKVGKQKTFYRIFWDFELVKVIQPGPSKCPSKNFFLRIRGANYNPNLNNRSQFIYPQEIQKNVPKTGDTVKMKVEYFLFSDPILKDTYDDFRIENYSKGFIILND